MPSAARTASISRAASGGVRSAFVVGIEDRQPPHPVIGDERQAAGACAAARRAARVLVEAARRLPEMVRM